MAQVVADSQDTAESKVVCARCNLEILDSDDYIVSRCNGQGCGEEITCHQGYVVACQKLAVSLSVVKLLQA